MHSSYFVAEAHVYACVWQQLRRVHSHRAAHQASFSVQTAGVYQFSHRALILGVSRGTFGATVTETAPTAATKLAAKVSSQFQLNCTCKRRSLLSNMAERTR